MRAEGSRKMQYTAAYFKNGKAVGIPITASNVGEAVAALFEHRQRIISDTTEEEARHTLLLNADGLIIRTVDVISGSVSE